MAEDEDPNTISKIEKNKTKEHKKKGGENRVKNLHDMDYLNLLKR